MKKLPDGSFETIRVSVSTPWTIKFQCYEVN
jgi:hypothetical protein